MNIAYKAFLVTENEGVFSGKLTELNTIDLPHNDLLVRVKYSSLNYKDALSASGNKGVSRKYPHVPGIDAAGIVVQSNVDGFPEGTEVIVTGFDLGMNTWGGFGEYISVPATWAIALPAGMSLRTAMCFGTAGLTAGLSVNKLIEAGITPDMEEVAISGASGGVGSLATAILSKLGYNTVAISGKQNDDFLIGVLGAKRTVQRQDFIAETDAKAMAKTVFSAGVDCVGGTLLSGLLKSTHYNGIVTCCGMVSSASLDTSIFPFILRGVTLAGIDSVLAPIAVRKKVWEQLANDWMPINFEKMTKEINITELGTHLQLILEGKATGRYILSHY